MDCLPGAEGNDMNPSIESLFSSCDVFGFVSNCQEGAEATEGGQREQHGQHEQGRAMASEFETTDLHLTSSHDKDGVSAFSPLLGI